MRGGVYSPWLCGQSSRWKMTIRGLLLKHMVPVVSLMDQLTIDINTRAGSLDNILGPGPVQSLFIGLSPDQLISPTWTTMVTAEIKFVIFVKTVIIQP